MRRIVKLTRPQWRAFGGHEFEQVDHVKWDKCGLTTRYDCAGDVYRFLFFLFSFGYKSTLKIRRDLRINKYINEGKECM